MDDTNKLAEAEKLLDAWTDESGDFGWMFSTSGALMGNKPSRDDLIKLIVRAKADVTPPSAQPPVALPAVVDAEALLRWWRWLLGYDWKAGWDTSAMCLAIADEIRTRGVHPAPASASEPEPPRALPGEANGEVPLVDGLFPAAFMAMVLESRADLNAMEEKDWNGMRRFANIVWRAALATIPATVSVVNAEARCGSDRPPLPDLPTGIPDAFRVLMTRYALKAVDEAMCYTSCHPAPASASEPEPPRALPGEAIDVYRIALENIACEKPRHERVSRFVGSGERMRCYHCGFAWQPDCKPHHAFGCAYVEAVDALAAGRIATPASLSGMSAEPAAAGEPKSHAIPRDLAERLTTALGFLPPGLHIDGAPATPAGQSAEGASEGRTYFSRDYFDPAGNEDEGASQGLEPGELPSFESWWQSWPFSAYKDPRTKGVAHHAYRAGKSVGEGFADCPNCLGDGRDGDVDDYGRMVGFDCHQCNGTGKVRAALRAGQGDGEAAAFKNFHRALCARFGYTHDEKDWRRDLVSLEEHIAKRVANPQTPAHADVERSPNRDLSTWPIRGVRVDQGTVVIVASGGVKSADEAARWMCGELLAMKEAR